MGQAVARRFAQEGFHAACVRRGAASPVSLTGERGEASLEAFCAEVPALLGDDGTPTRIRPCH